MIHDKHTIQRPFAVITGASHSFGYEFARQLASKGFDLLMTGTDENIFHLKQELSCFGVIIEAHKLSLGSYQSTEKLCQLIKQFGHPIDVLVICAVEGQGGAFVHETKLRSETELVLNNILSPLHLLKKVLREMTARGHGRVLMMAPFSFENEDIRGPVSLACHSFLLTLMDSLRREVHDKGVTLTDLILQSSDTASESEILAWANPVELARESFEALMAGRDHVFHYDFMTKVQDVIGRIIPRGPP
jgi:short-subunit dehydrogenase